MLQPGMRDENYTVAYHIQIYRADQQYFLSPPFLVHRNRIAGFIIEKATMAIISLTFCSVWPNGMTNGYTRTINVLDSKSKLMCITLCST